MPPNELVGVANVLASVPIGGRPVALIRIPPAPAEAALAVGDDV